MPNPDIKKINQTKLEKIADAFEILGMPGKSGDSVLNITTAFKKLVVSVDPDRNPQEKDDATKACQKLFQAREWALSEDVNYKPSPSSHWVTNVTRLATIFSKDGVSMNEEDVSKARNMMVMMMPGEFKKAGAQHAVSIRQFFLQLELGQSSTAKADKTDLLSFVELFFPQPYMSSDEMSMNGNARMIETGVLVLLSLMIRYPKLLENYDAFFVKQLINFLTKIEQALRSIIHNRGLEDPCDKGEKITFRRFEHFVKEFMRKDDKIMVVKSDDCPTINVLRILNKHVKSGAYTPIFSNLVKAVNVLRADVDSSDLFVYSQTDLEGDVQKAKDVDNSCERWNQGDILNAQLSYIIWLILGENFNDSTPSLLQQQFPKCADDNSASFWEKNEITPVIPHLYRHPVSSFFGWYKKYYAEGNLGDLDHFLENPIIDALEHTWKKVSCQKLDRQTNTSKYKADPDSTVTLFKAVEDAACERAQDIIQSYPALVNASHKLTTGDYQTLLETPLIHAVLYAAKQRGKHNEAAKEEELLSLAKFILNHDKCDILTQDGRGNNVLHLAIWYVYPEIAEIIIAKAKKTECVRNICAAKNTRSETPWVTLKLLYTSETTRRNREEENQLKIMRILNGIETKEEEPSRIFPSVFSSTREKPLPLPISTKYLAPGVKAPGSLTLTYQTSSEAELIWQKLTQLNSGCIMVKNDNKLYIHISPPLDNEKPPRGMFIKKEGNNIYKLCIKFPDEATQHKHTFMRILNVSEEYNFNHVVDKNLICIDPLVFDKSSPTQKSLQSSLMI